MQWWKGDLADFAATGPGYLAVIDLTMNFSIYQSILESKLTTKASLKLGHATGQRSQAQQQIYKRTAQKGNSPDLKLTEMLWVDSTWKNVCKLHWTEALLWRRVAQNSSTVTRDWYSHTVNNHLYMLTVLLLNGEVYLVYHRTA